MRVRSLLLTGTIVGAAFALAGPASAESQADQIKAQQAQIDYMRRQIDLMQQKLLDLQTQSQTTQQQVAAVAAPAAKPGPKVTQSAANKFALESADGQYSIGLTGVVQADVGSYVGFRPDSKVVGTQNLNSGFNVRRARIGVTGKAAGDWTYTFIYDGGNSSDATPKGIETAQISYGGFKGASIDLGYSNTLFTLDQATGSGDTIFLERATPSNIATNLNTGDARSNAGVRFFNDRYWLGGYFTGPASGDAHGVAERLGAFQRATYQVLQDSDYTLHLGVGVDELFKAPNGGPGTANAISLSDQPELRIDTATFANTGTLGTLANPVTSALVYDVEAAGNYQNFFFQGEYYHYQIDRRGLADADFDGAYGQIAWTITGESHKYNPATASYVKVVPTRPFSLEQGTWGAWEVAARISYVDLVDDFTAGRSLTLQPSAIDGGKQTSFTAGLNWYPNSYLRFELNYLHTDYDRANPTAVAGAALGVPVGASFDTIALRSQVQW